MDYASRVRPLVPRPTAPASFRNGRNSRFTRKAVWIWEPFLVDCIDSLIDGFFDHRDQWEAMAADPTAFDMR